MRRVYQVLFAEQGAPWLKVPCLAIQLENSGSEGVNRGLLVS